MMSKNFLHIHSGDNVLAALKNLPKGTLIEHNGIDVYTA